MIRWTFIFEEGHVSVDVRDEAEDLRISDRVNVNDELLYIPSQGKDAYVNLRLVKMIMREIIEEQAPAEPVKEPEAPLVD